MPTPVGAQPLQYIRRTAGDRQEDFAAGGGRGTAATEAAPVDFLATVDPLPGEIKETLPEGERLEKNYYLITETTLRSRDDYGAEASDYVLYKGETFEVMTVQTYDRVIPHSEVRIMRVRPEVV